MLKLIVMVIGVVCFQPLALAADARMQVNVLAEAHNVQVQWLHANMRKAAALALPQLWARIVPQDAHALIPKRIKALRFLQKATPTNEGIRITFHQKRVLNYLKNNNLPYIAQQPVLNVALQLYNKDGHPMRETANALLNFAISDAPVHGYRVDEQGASLVLLWRWLDYKQVSLSVRGHSKLTEFTETRYLKAGDPLEQIQPWMRQVLLQARDAYAEGGVTQPVDEHENVVGALQTVAGDNAAIIELVPHMPKAEVGLRLMIHRSASLLDQVLFEDELIQDPRILDLSLRQVNKESQQYSLQLKGSDDQWLAQWFARRGMTLTPTIEGWVAR
ncbi:MAG: hypothetical protein JKY87_05790 [Mariprofundus sp.]|nr:hypothetical protein [Mariprofundus sp.]